MMKLPASEPTSPHPYRSAPAPRAFAPESGCVPYDGQTRVRLTISSGLAHARIVIDPAARDLIAVGCGPDRRPRLHLDGGELSLSWHQSFSDWLCGVLTAGSVFVSNLSFTTEMDQVTILLHPAVDWSIAIRGGVSHLDCDLSAGAVEAIDIAGGVSRARLELPAPQEVVPVRISGGVSHLALRRPADTGVSLAVTGGLCDLRLDDRKFSAIGGAAELETRNLTDASPRYDLAIRGGACELTVARG